MSAYLNYAVESGVGVRVAISAGNSAQTSLADYLEYFAADPETGVALTYLEGVAELCRKWGILLIVDETMTGMGRTGKMFAIEHYPIEPDIMVMAKGIAGGMPMGALVSTAAVRHSLKPGLHGSTFGGNPIAARIGVMNLMVFMAFIGFNGFITPYAESMGVTSVRWIMLTYSGTTLALRAFGGRLLDRGDRMRLASTAFTGRMDRPTMWSRSRGCGPCPPRTGTFDDASHAW